MISIGQEVCNYDTTLDAEGKGLAWHGIDWIGYLSTLLNEHEHVIAFDHSITSSAEYTGPRQ